MLVSKDDCRSGIYLLCLREYLLTPYACSYPPLALPLFCSLYHINKHSLYPCLPDSFPGCGFVLVHCCAGAWLPDVICNNVDLYDRVDDKEGKGWNSLVVNNVAGLEAGVCDAGDACFTKRVCYG